MRARSPAPASLPEEAPWRAALPALAVFAAAVLAFLPALANGFTGWDDTVYTSGNPSLRSFAGLGRIWTSSESEQYYPLAFTSYWIEQRLFGGSAAGHHATSVLLHGANAVLVLLLLRALRLSRWTAVAGALLFAVHPSAVMSVAWIAERKNQLSALFLLLATLAWIRSRERPSRGAYAASLAAFAAALLSKTQVLGLPLALLVLDRWHLGARARSSLLRVAPMLALAAAGALVTRAFEERFLDPYTLAATPPFAERLQLAGAAVWWYLAHAALPLLLSPFYPLWPVSAGALRWWLPLALLVAALVAVVLRRERIDGRALFGLALFLIMLAPSLGLVPLANLAITPVSDHYLYAASMGLALCAGLGLERLRLTAAGRAAAGALVAALLAGYLVQTERYLPAFRDGESLWRRTLGASPDSYVGHLGLAEVLAARGALAEARPHYARAIAIRPDWIDAHQRLGAALVRAGDLHGAEAPLARALELSPGNAAALCDLAAVRERTGRADSALELLERAVRADPASVRARMELGRLDLAFGRYAEAEAEFRAVLEREPALARAWLGAATGARGSGRYARAVELLRDGLTRTGDDVGLTGFLALVLASAKDDAVRDGAEAVRLAEDAARRTDLADPEILSTLAAAYAEVGRFEEAERVARDAAGRARSAGLADLAAESDRQAAQYARREPLRR